MVAIDSLRIVLQRFEGLGLDCSTVSIIEYENENQIAYISLQSPWK